MFKTEHILNKNPLLNRFHIYNDVVSCKICPNLGASIQELSFHTIHIIDGINLSENGLLTYKKSYQSALLFPFVGRIPNGEYNYKNNSYKLENNEPNCTNALHGLVYDKLFKIDTYEVSNSKAKVQLTYMSDGTLKGFPFKFKFQAIYVISNDGIKISFKVLNNDKRSFPFGFGWHPYFKTDHLSSSSLSFSSDEKLKCNEHLIPIGFIKNPEPSTFIINNKLFDDTFILLKNQVNFKTKHYEVQMNFSTTNNGYLQVFTPLHKESIAIEPNTCAPNAFNTKEGLLELKPNKTHSWAIDFKVKTNV
jgi:aldose 1-epimerase